MMEYKRLEDKTMMEDRQLSDHISNNFDPRTPME